MHGCCPKTTLSQGASGDAHGRPQSPERPKTSDRPQVWEANPTLTSTEANHLLERHWKQSLTLSISRSSMPLRSSSPSPEASSREKYHVSVT
jgi:hypothetical protein